MVIFLSIALVRAEHLNVIVIAACLSFYWDVQPVHTSVSPLWWDNTVSSSHPFKLTVRSGGETSCTCRLIGGLLSLWQLGLNMLQFTVHMQCAYRYWKEIVLHALTSKREEEAAVVTWDTESCLPETWDAKITQKYCISDIKIHPYTHTQHAQVCQCIRAGGILLTHMPHTLRLECLICHTNTFCNITSFSTADFTHCCRPKPNLVKKKN